ncbi:hypothetical protein AALA24_05295 [Anaerovoracaceae bacterium 42-11]|uniref:hypothetical protein n=1 Tax=Senimuribacter intestinalis TaxID=2941507 RepID=UPI00203B602B|nr:hypothetical protein [Senimuribacter intestinalis]
MDSLGTALLSILLSVLASIVTTRVLNSKLYFTFHRGKLLEDLILRGDIQVRSSTISSPADWENFDYQNCYYFTISKNSPVKICNLSECKEIDFYKRYRYIHVRNNSSLCILIAELHLKNGVTQNLYDWSSVEMEPSQNCGLIIDSYDDVTELTIDYNGRDIHYAITDKKGYATCKIQKRRKNHKKVREVIVANEILPEQVDPLPQNEQNFK